MGDQAESDPDELLSVEQLAREYGLGRSTVWLYLRRHQVPRYRTAVTGKTTLVRRSDWEKALHAPIPVTRSDDRQRDSTRS